MTYYQLFTLISNDFKRNDIDDYLFQSKQLILSYFGFNNTDFVLQAHNEIQSEFVQLLENSEKLIRGVPLQYLIGKWEFMGLDFEVGEGVLIPRPETEMLVELAIENLKDIQSPVVLDLCSGTGCVGISVAKLIPNSVVYLFEKYDKPIEYINKNVILNKVNNIKVVKWDITNPYPFNEKVDCILSNPPYINSMDILNLQKQVQFEPKTALDGGDDGLLFYRAINNSWLDVLKANGYVAVEHGDGQGPQIKSIFQHKLRNIKISDDLSGIDRIVSGFKKEMS